MEKEIKEHIKEIKKHLKEITYWQHESDLKDNKIKELEKQVEDLEWLTKNNDKVLVARWMEIQKLKKQLEVKNTELLVCKNKINQKR